MKKFMTITITAIVIIIMGLACAVNTEAATVRYAKSVSEIVPEGEYILEAAEYPMSQTKKVRTDAKTGRVIFKFVNVKSGKAMTAGGYALFYVRIVE